MIQANKTLKREWAKARASTLVYSRGESEVSLMETGYS
jgi:hypothetical protein